VTASRPEARARRRYRRRAALALAIGLVLAGCQSPAPLEPALLLEPTQGPAPHPPDAVDLAAAHLAAVALAGDRAALGDAVDAVGAAERERLALDRDEPAGARRLGPRSKVLRQRPPRGRLRVLPHAIDVANSTLDDEIAYRDASQELLRRGDLDAGLRERLQREVDDDPLRLANRRIRDHREKLFAATFNAVSAPLGRSLLTGFITAPYQLANSATHWLASLFERSAMDVQERQALVHRRRFLAAHPDSPDAPAVARQVADAQAELARSRLHAIRSNADAALEHGNPALARALAEQALVLDPGDSEAAEIRDRADARVARGLELRRRSLQAVEATPRDLALAPDATRRAAEALWVAPRDLPDAARALARADPGGELDDEAVFLLALAQYEAGLESQSWERLDGIAGDDPRRSNMARHARALAGSAWRNPYRSFVELRRRGRGRTVLNDLLGGWAERPRYQRIPRPLAYLVDLPAIAQTIVTAPLRFVLTRFGRQPDYQHPAAVAAYRYLALHPDGQHRREVVDWLYDYERSRENWPAALRLADFRPHVDSDARQELVEKSADLGLHAADRAHRPDRRASLLRELVREFPESDAGRTAGLAARQEVERASPQRIRMTRGFLEENPRITGSQGLGLHPALLDGQLWNGELHPDGVTFLGGRVLEFSLMPESGKEEDEPVRVQRQVSSERLARCVALVEETAQISARLDPDDELAADSERDYYFERARLGLTGRPDLRPAAQSTYVFQGVRERYGMVRGRESILPFDLVLTGSLLDLSLGAYPRWREPKETPDAFLYR
jgi:hypothetical protein